MEYCEELDCYMMDETTKQIFREWDWEIFEHQVKEEERENTKVNIAKNFLKLGTVPLKDIASSTGLKMKELKKLQTQILLN